MLTVKGHCERIVLNMYKGEKVETYIVTPREGDITLEGVMKSYEY